METAFKDLAYSLIQQFAITEGVKVYYPNREVKGDKPDLYLRVWVYPVDPTTLTIADGGSIYQWILQVTVHVLAGTGELETQLMVDKLRELIPPVKDLVGDDNTFRSIKTARVAPPVDDDRGWFYTPVQFRFQTIT
ncbi:MAG: hypothetical protein GY941_19830 [Planctomycetes bacterium]|nr:hypothetical protein [Planctomycetota bacterium]